MRLKIATGKNLYFSKMCELSYFLSSKSVAFSRMLGGQIKGKNPRIQSTDIQLVLFDVFAVKFYATYLFES